MSLRSAKPVTILFIIVASMATTFSPVRSHFHHFPSDISECWSSLKNAQVCFEEIEQFLHGQCDGISAACCDAVEEIGKSCLAKSLPINPFFPQILESFCAGGPAAAPAETGGSISGANPGFWGSLY